MTIHWWQCSILSNNTCLYFVGLNFCELLFLIISLKKFHKYAVEAGNGAVSNLALKYFREWHRIRENLENLDLQKYKCYTVHC